MRPRHPPTRPPTDAPARRPHRRSPGIADSGADAPWPVGSGGPGLMNRFGLAAGFGRREVSERRPTRRRRRPASCRHLPLRRRLPRARRRLRPARPGWSRPAAGAADHKRSTGRPLLRRRMSAQVKRRLKFRLDDHRGSEQDVKKSAKVFRLRWCVVAVVKVTASVERSAGRADTDDPPWTEDPVSRDAPTIWSVRLNTTTGEGNDGDDDTSGR